MESTKKILILTADAGFGHRSAALAVDAALCDRYGSAVQTEIVNPLDDKRAPFFLRDSQSDYDQWIKNFPELYKLGYEASDSPVPKVLMEQTLATLLLDVMRDQIKKSEPDVIFSTYPLYQSAVHTALVRQKNRLPSYCAITDLSTVHRLWFNTKVSGLFVPNRHVAELAMDNGVAPAKISITGIPVHPDLVRETRTKVEIRKELGLDLDTPTILAVSSRRVEHMLDALNVINHFGAPLQLILVAGKDDQLYNTATQMEWHIPVKIFNFVENMPTLMHAADIMLCKAGGLIVTESLACGLPLILIDVLPGQETGNAEYVRAYGAGDMSETPIQLLEVLSDWMRNNGSLYKKRSANAKLIGMPNSSFTIADILWKAANAELAPVHHRREPHRPLKQGRLRRKSHESKSPSELASDIAQIGPES
ncbi:MAG: glycosyltransferase [Anaerolineaceae bacterium]